MTEFFLFIVEVVNMVKLKLSEEIPCVSVIKCCVEKRILLEGCHLSEI